MSSEQRKQKLAELITEYNKFKEQGKLDLTSEETIRTWLNELLAIFDWDVRDTSQILQEKVLSKAEKEKLKGIGSQNTRPDYTFKVARQKLTFLDAKDISVKILDDTEAAFQIKSYGWSILAPCAFISNFEEFAIYDCTYTPKREQNANLGRLYFTLDDYIEKFEILEAHLLKENIYKGKLDEIYSSSFQGNRYVEKTTPDFKFAQQLSDFRLALATDILNNNADYIRNNSANLSYIVQIIINRILFIRVCEARKIEEEGLLLSFKEKGFWNEFKNSSYFDFFEHYDGPLFDRINAIHEIEISNEVFDQLLQVIYYPSPYRFDVIPTKVLSDIYEIFLSKKLLIENNEVKDEIKSEYLKTKGAVSTPQYIVQEIIRRTIPKQKLLEEGIEALFDKKILDIACGSGVFAIEVYDYIEEIFRELFFISNHPDFQKYFVATNDDVIVNVLGKKAIMDNCIFGIDIDPEAVEVAKMSLSLKIIDTSEYLESYNEIGLFGNKILNGVGNNIRCGNSLVESDILEKFPALEHNEDEFLNTNIFDWESEQGFSKIFEEKRGFDYIVGNPPYVEVKHYNIDLPYMHLYIKTRFPSSKNGKVDLAIPFIERGIELLNPTGRLGYIVQKRFFKTEYGKKIREIITTSNYLSSVIDFEATSIFKDRITYVAVLLLDKSSSDNFSFKLYDGTPETLPSQLRETETPDIAPEQYSIIPASAVSANPWSFDDNQLIEIKTRLLENGSLGDYAKVRVGVQVLWDRAYHIRPISVENGIIRGKSHIEEDFEIEFEACRPLICNENFYPYRKDNADVFVIFPYDVTDGIVTEIKFSDFRERFPLASEYLQRNKATIESTVETLPKKFPEKYDDNNWHLFTRVQNHGATYPKILVPMTALDTFATVTFSVRTYCDNANVFFIDIPQKDENSLYALSAVINSTVYSVLARSIANPQSNGYFKFNKQFLEPVPFPVSNFRENEQLKSDLAVVAKRIDELQTNYKSSSPTQQRSISRLLSTQWNTLDELCYQLYGLTDEEKVFFSDRGRNIDRIQILN
ncbi:MAG: N-6 DNA methylase [Pedobacter sp.]|uniref:Eco57I restriction-modification methylase domain-containing protein n=1 Tax=Pedobacter sp. TaxID=1411316 RepID=UPI00280A359B|nr:N-6 DNA methylase [Pedobacter sp.]MDQ8006386.1 N-6 DNA methylase [Pedobacter sp.]